MEGIYSRRRHLGRVREFGKYDGLSGRIWERDKRRRSMMSREEKSKVKGDKGRVESRGRKVQEK